MERRSSAELAHCLLVSRLIDRLIERQQSVSFYSSATAGGSFLTVTVLEESYAVLDLLLGLCSVDDLVVSLDGLVASTTRYRA